MTKFYSIISNSDKVCHIKRDHLVNFTFHFKKYGKCDISETVRPIATKFNVSLK